MRSLTGRQGSGSNRSPPQSLLVIEKDGSVFGRNWRRRTCGQKTAQDRDRDNQLAHSRHLLSRSKCPGSALRSHARLRPWPERLGQRTGWDRALRSHKPHAPRRCLSRLRKSSRLAPNSSSLLTQPPRSRSAGPGIHSGRASPTRRYGWPEGSFHVSRARVPSSSGVGSPSVPNRPVRGTLLRRDCQRFRREAPRIPLRTAALRH